MQDGVRLATNGQKGWSPKGKDVVTAPASLKRGNEDVTLSCHNNPTCRPSAHHMALIGEDSQRKDLVVSIASGTIQVSYSPKDRCFVIQPSRWTWAS